MKAGRSSRVCIRPLAGLSLLNATKGVRMTTKPKPTLPQPKPFTPGLTPGMVRDHAYQLYRDKLDRGALTLEDWVLAEKDLAASLDADEESAR